MRAHDNCDNPARGHLSHPLMKILSRLVHHIESRGLADKHAHGALHRVGSHTASLLQQHVATWLRRVSRASKPLARQQAADPKVHHGRNTQRDRGRVRAHLTDRTAIRVWAAQRDICVADVIGQLVQLATNCGWSDVLQTTNTSEKRCEP